MLPDLFGIAQLNVCSLFNKLGVSLQEVNAPAGVFFQAIKLILKHKKKMFSSFTYSISLPAAELWIDYNAWSTLLPINME